MAENLKKRVVRNSFWTFLFRAINRLGSLVFVIILARFLLPEAYGLYSIVLSTAMIFVVFADLGVGPTAVRYISHSLEKDKKKVPAYYRYILKIKFALSFLVAVSLLILAYPLAIYVFHNSELVLPLAVAALYIFIYAFDTFHQNLFFAFEEINYVSVKEAINQILRIGLLFAVIYFASGYYEVTGVFVMFAFVSSIGIAYSLYYLWKLNPEIFEKPKIKINRRGIVKFIGYLTIANISNAFFVYMDVFILGIFVLPEFVGYYRAASSLVLGVTGIVAFPALILLPMFSKLNRENSEKILNGVSKYVMIIAVPSFVGLAVLSDFFVRALFGVDYMGAVIPLIVVSFMIIPSLYINFILPLFTAEEKPWIFARLVTITVVINLVLDFILVILLKDISGVWAAAGVGFATVLSGIIYLAFSTYYLNKEFSIKVQFRGLFKPFLASIIMAIVILYLKWEVFSAGFKIWTGIVEIVVGIVVYFVVMILIGGLTKKDFWILKGLRK